MRPRCTFCALLALAACDEAPADPTTTTSSTGGSSTSGTDPTTTGDPTTSDDGTSEESTSEGSTSPPEPAQGRTMFVTSAAHSPDFGGLAGADAICQQAASALVGEPAATSFRAWLSVPGQSAAERLEHWDGPYLRTDGSQIAANWDNLVDGALDVRINRDESGQLVEGVTLAWTGTHPDGTAAAEDDSCAGWTSTEAVAVAGSVDDNGPWWTSFGEMPCDQSLRLYCVEQPPACGDGVLNDGEECDNGADNDDSAVCTSTCQLATCGDGLVFAVVEQCDDANADEADGCLSNCTVPGSCLDVLQADPGALSGSYLIDPTGAGPFVVQCDMELDGGGWTLAFNEFNGVFDVFADGVTDDSCYASNCTNRAYSTVPVVGDITFDADDVDMVGAAYGFRSRINGVHPDTVGHTIRELVTTPNPASGLGWFTDAEDNANVTNDGPVDLCNTAQWGDYDAVCDATVVTFHDDGQNAIGLAASYTVVAGNAATWPAENGYPGFWPTRLRIWVR